MRNVPELIAIAWLSAAPLAANAAAGSDVYPNRPIRIITSDPGNSNDFLSRLLADALSGPLGQPVVVENRGGGGGAPAIDRLLNSVPDGHTIMLHGTSIWLVPLMSEKPSWNPLRDFAPVAIAARNPAVLVVPASLPAKSVKELIDYSKARPGQLNYASLGDGSPAHLGAELFTSLAGINVVRLFFKGGAFALTSLIQGESHMMVNAIAPAMVHVRAGRLRALGVTGPSAQVPDLPQVGVTLPGYEWITHNVIFAHPKTPPAVVNRLNAEIVKALGRPEVNEALKLGMELGGSAPQEVTAMMKREMARMKPVIERAGIKH